MDNPHDVNILYRTETGELMAVIWSDLITYYRTGAMGGVSAKCLAQSDGKLVADSDQRMYGFLRYRLASIVLLFFFFFAQKISALEKHDWQLGAEEVIWRALGNLK